MQTRFFPKGEIESRAEKLLSDYVACFAAHNGAGVERSRAATAGLSSSHAEFPLDLDGLVFDFLYERDGLGLDDEKDLGHDGASGDKILGKTIVERRVIEVDVSLQAPGEEGRRNFTIAHEIGHWILHRSAVLQSAKQSLLFDDAPPVFVSLNRNISAELSSRLPPQEWQANFFAASLLMPEKAVRKLFLELMESIGLPPEPISLCRPKTLAALREVSASSAKLCGLGCDNVHAPAPLSTLRDMSLFVASQLPGPRGETLCQRFGVSRTAMRIRLQQVGCVTEMDYSELFG